MNDINEKVGFIDARTQGISEDVKEIKEMLNVLPTFHQRITDIEGDIKLAKRGLTWAGSGIIGIIVWLFKSS